MAALLAAGGLAAGLGAGMTGIAHASDPTRPDPTRPGQHSSWSSARPQ
jgi:hypothetical protein